MCCDGSGGTDASAQKKTSSKRRLEHVIDVETVVIAIGQSPNPLIKATMWALKLKMGWDYVDEQTGATSKPGVYAGGDVVTGAATVILAMGAGKKAAAAIDEYLQQKA